MSNDIFNLRHPATCEIGDTVPWQSLLKAIVALAFTSMSQPSFVNRYIHEKPMYIAHISPFMALADALDILIRIGVFFFGSKKLSFRQAIICARATFATAPGKESKKVQNRSIYMVWLYFLLSIFGPAGTIFRSTGIILTQVVAGIFIFSIVIRLLVDMVPEIIEDEDSYLPHKAGRVAAWKARIAEKNDMLESISQKLQTYGCFTSLGVLALVISITCMTKVPMSEDPSQLEKDVIVFASVLLGFMWTTCLPLFSCAVFTSLYSLSWPDSVSLALPYYRTQKGCCHSMSRDWKRFIDEDIRSALIYSLGLLWMSALIAYYAGLYNRCGTSRAGVSEWFQ